MRVIPPETPSALPTPSHEPLLSRKGLVAALLPSRASAPSSPVHSVPLVLLKGTECATEWAYLLNTHLDPLNCLRHVSTLHTCRKPRHVAPEVEGETGRHLISGGDSRGLAGIDHSGSGLCTGMVGCIPCLKLPLLGDRITRVLHSHVGTLTRDNRHFGCKNRIGALGLVAPRSAPTAQRWIRLIRLTNDFLTNQITTNLIEGVKHTNNNHRGVNLE